MPDPEPSTPEAKDLAAKTAEMAPADRNPAWDRSPFRAIGHIGVSLFASTIISYGCVLVTMAICVLIAWGFFHDDHDISDLSSMGPVLLFSPVFFLLALLVTSWIGMLLGLANLFLFVSAMTSDYVHVLIKRCMILAFSICISLAYFKFCVSD